MDTKYDVVIIGGGHNGLVSASYLARSGLKVFLLEKNDHFGGASISTKPFGDYDAWLSEYSYLVSLFPKQIIKDLGLKFKTKKRKIASYTPIKNGNNSKGLLISNRSDTITRKSFEKVTDSHSEYKGYLKLQSYVDILAGKIWPTMLSTLKSKDEMKRKFVGENEVKTWEYFFEKPLGYLIEKNLKNDLVRGLLFTDAKIGVSTYPDDTRLIQNKTFLYHVIGGGTGDWLVPVGGMKSLIKELVNCSRKAGAEILTQAEVKRVEHDVNGSEVELTHKGKRISVEASIILSNIAPKALKNILKEYHSIGGFVEGSVFKINILLKKLPELLDSSVTKEDAFNGTFHLDEGYDNMIESYKTSQSGRIPSSPPGEMYCHTLTDPSLLSKELRDKGFHTLTLFGLDMPYSLFKKDNDKTKKIVLKNYFKVINKYLKEPIENCIAKDKKGNLCVEAKTPIDLENELGMPGGNIFHNGLSWPFAENRKLAGTWGVETNLENVFICGSGAVRGGCVSGVPGHNAARKVLEILGKSSEF